MHDNGNGTLNRDNRTESASVELNQEGENDCAMAKLGAATGSSPFLGGLCRSNRSKSLPPTSRLLSNFLS